MEILFALFAALILTSIFAGGVRGTRSWDGLGLFFLILFLVSWAGSLWIVPYGPIIAGVSWLPLLGLGLMVALLMTAFIPPNWTPSQRRTVDGVEENVLLGISWFFWGILLILGVSVLFGYLI